MNKYIKSSVLFAAAALVLTSCEDLDTEYKGKYITTEQKELTLKTNPQMGMAGVAGISASANQYMSIYSNHFDFGYPAVMLGMDLQGNDMVGDWSGYNWFRYWEGFTSPTSSGTPSTEAWYTIYSQIFSCNALSATIADDTSDADQMFYKAQAVGTRAFDYWVLAQLYQFNYKGHESAPCVPIITELNQAEASSEGCPRATVQEVYDQIMKDIDLAIELLEKSGRQPSQMISSKPKRFISVAAAYGLRARFNLTMHKYAEAAADAQSAIANFNGAPLSIDAAGHPGFWSIDESNWMWGFAINSSDRIVTSGIVNWPSMMNTFAQGGYTSVGAWKDCSEKLYNAIPNSDVRKNWFLDENLQSKGLTGSYSQFQACVNGQASPCRPYTNVKFAGCGGTAYPTENANDIPLMRIEEMYYIAAEGLAMSGNTAEAKTMLETFEKTYRNSNYVCSATTPEEFQNEVYQKRRVELWGEGLSWFDLMRLDLPVDRLDQNWPAEVSFIIPSEATNTQKRAAVRIYCIPQGEINANKQISQDQNNDSFEKPDPGTWLDF